MKFTKKWEFFILFIIIGILLAACGGEGVKDPVPLPEGTYPPDELFVDFYNKHGGVDFFGYAITNLFTNERGDKAQYYESVVMAYDANSQTVYFEPIGRELNLGQQPVANWSGETTGGVFVGTHFIHPAFASLYLKLGPDLVGDPLTDPYINISQNRIEQHFENLGFYLDLGEPEARAKALFYGRLHCISCNYENPMENAVVTPGLADSAVILQMKELGLRSSLLGNLVDGPVERYDGTQDYIFDYMVLRENQGLLEMQHVPVELGLAEEVLYLPLNNSNFVFYEISDGGGHNVFYLFDEFVQAHGGYAISGPPISSLTGLDATTNVLRQCFAHYCLDFVPDAPGQSVRPVPLGELFFEKFSEEYRKPKIGGEPGGEDDDDGSSPGGITDRNLSPFILIAGEAHPNVDSQMTQVLFFWVKLQQTPQPDKELVLTITYPDGREEVVAMEPTDDTGFTSYTLAPIPGENGNLVRYEACLHFDDLSPICVEQIFMIWGNP